MKNWKFVKTGNDSLITKDGRVNYPDKEIGEINILKRELEGLMRMAQSDKTHDYTKQIEALKKEISEKKNKYAVGNESIEKQEWSMFKGLSKDAEKEVGNELPTEQDLKNWIRMSQQDMKDAQREMEKNKPLGHPDSYREENYGRAKVKYDEAAKAIKKMEEELRQGKYKKVGNANTVSEYNAEIQRLTKKAEQLRRMGQGRSAMEVEKQIEKLGKELRELGNKKVGNTNWKQTGSNEWATELPNGSKIVVYYEKGVMADWHYQIDHKKSNTYIGCWARDKQEAMTESVERAKRLGNSKTGNARPKEQLLADVRELTKYIQEHNGQGCEKEKRLLGEAKEELDKNYGIIVGNSKTGNTGHWNSSKTMYAKWDDASGRPADEYAVITWLGEGKGGLVNIWKGHQMTSEKYGSYDLSDLRRWAEQRIGNETLAEYAKSKPRVINGLSRARNAMTKNSQITLWNGNDSVLISENGLVQYLENNSFETDRAKYDSQEKAVEELTKKGYHKK